MLCDTLYHCLRFFKVVIIPRQGVPVHNIRFSTYLLCITSLNGTLIRFKMFTLPNFWCLEGVWVPIPEVYVEHRLVIITNTVNGVCFCCGVLFINHLFIFSVEHLSVLRGHSVFSSPPQRPMTSDFEGFLSQIVSIIILFLSLFFRKSQYFLF